MTPIPAQVPNRGDVLSAGGSLTVPQPQDLGLPLDDPVASSRQDVDVAVLLLRLAAPMQSWGAASSFNRRDTRPEPTKSGIVGLLAAALGWPRDADLTELTQLRLGVRVDQPGSLLRDYHTLSDYRGVPLRQAGVNAKGIQKFTSPAKHTHQTWRYYLQDAAFLAGVAGPRTTLQALAVALSRPAFPLALGRRSCPPTQPVNLGLRGGNLLQALESEPWQASESASEAFVRRRGHRPATIDLPLTIDDDNGNEVRHDVPVSFDPRDRRFIERRVRHVSVRVPSRITNPDPETTGTDHDPFALLGW
ncbi:type I-E CRISPR-associated protein Cas5/CasD [Nocardia sp. SYP-A9097]|uniref:type I-E CRISPR-associated protein Cas5/CasD n=1 Tax=Nocardia sp. SYP-A9097 TaxID=2663237 RepID=UPI00129BC066|nr:type I-E CRISPR-associated protein Cas5/CasD [Nocardia sp. SYP-A9097]MRH93419.1 type I-E CRISPR-associated protein Cas5/CasD [Nocardia sp. SYP-A9097]